MKKLIYISGIAAANLLLSGCLFKVFHWPGASVLLCLAVFLFCFVFLPFALLNSYQNQEQKKHGGLYIVTFVTFFIGVLGILFKVMHWPGASIFLFVGIPLPFVLFLPVYLYQTREEKNRDSRNFLGIMFGLTFLAVFSVLLTINVSRDVLGSAGLNTNNNDKFVLFTQTKIKSFGTENKIAQQSDQLCAYIDGLKCELLTASQNAVCANYSVTLGYNPLTIINKDNSEIPVQVLFGEGDKNKLNELKQKIAGYRESVLSSGKASPALNELIGSLFDVSSIASDNPNEENLISWEERQFAGHQLMLVLDALSEIQSNIRLVESELLAVK